MLRIFWVHLTVPARVNLPIRIGVQSAGSDNKLQYRIGIITTFTPCPECTLTSAAHRQCFIAFTSD